MLIDRFQVSSSSCCNECVSEYHGFTLGIYYRREMVAMSNLEQLAVLLVDAIVNLDPQEFDAVADAVAGFKTEDQASYSALMNGGCKEFATLFGAIEQAVLGL